MDVTSVLAAVSSVASAVATVVLAVLTGRYVKLTHALVEETRVAKYPNVFIDLEFERSQVKLSVGNSGSGPAKNVRFDVVDRVPWRKMQGYAQGLSELSVVKNGISYLAPGRTLKFIAGLVDRDDDFFSSRSTIEVGLTFQTESGVELRRHFTIDLQTYSGVLYESFGDPQREVARAIRDAERDRASEARRSRSPLLGVKARCPTCGESVMQSARKCPHCHEAIPERKVADTDA
jgi:hypothetical protein